MLIKKSTIFYIEKSFGDLIKAVEANIEEQIRKENESSEYARKQLPIEQGYLQARLSRPMTSISRKLVVLYEESIESYTQKIKESDNRISTIKERGKSLIKEIKEKSSNYKLPDIHVLDIRYQPIFIDLNNNKTAQQYTRISCFNPKLNNEIRVFWENYDQSLIRPFSSGSSLFLPSIEVCNKFAKF